jgi:homoserine acetyltransferase
MATQDPYVADDYGRGGVIWMIKLSNNTPEANQIVKKVFNKLQEEYKKGKLSNEVESYAQYSFNDFKDVFDIEDILDAGQAWDNWEFVEWFKHAFSKINAVILPNGHYGDRAAVIIRPENVEVLGMEYNWEPEE